MALQHPNYAAFINASKASGIPEEQIAEISGIRDENEFIQKREEELKQYVEEPVQQLVRKIWEMGGSPYSSNAYGPGPKGVNYTNEAGEEKFLELKPPMATREEFEKRVPVAENPALSQLVNAQDFKGAVQLFKAHQNPFYRRVAELIEPLQNKVKFAKPQNINGGIYTVSKDSITIGNNFTGDERVVIHEMVHALVARSQIIPSPKQKKFVNEIKKLRNYTYQQFKKNGKLIDPRTGREWYAFNIDRDPNVLGLEFVTEAMSYPDFQYELMQIPYEKSKTVWSKFVELVADLLGIQNKTALTEAISLIESLAQTPRPKLPPRAVRTDELFQASEAARKQYTSTPAFKKWFGDSKVVDENGEPMVVYRGVRKVPSATGFKMTQGRSTPSFAADPEVANVYARSLDTREYERGSTMVPAYLSIKNPLDIRQLGEEVSLEGIVNMLPTDFEKASGMRTERNKRRVGYSDLAEAIRDMDSLTYETGARFNIDVLDNEGFRIKSFSDLADYIDDLGNEGDYASIDLALMDVTFDGYLIGDSPDWNYLLSSLGFDGVIHKDVFDVGSRYYKGDASKLEEGYEGPVHDTFRPFEQTQIKSAIGNRGAFDPKNPDILASEQAPIVERAQQILQKRPPLKLAPEITEEERRRLQETFAPDNKTIIDKVRGLEDRFWQRMAQKFADQFRTIKDYSEKGYMQARLSKAIDGAVEGLLFYGQVFNDGGALNIRPQTKGLIDILKPVGPEVDNFMIWIALNRETNLRAQEKEPSIPDDVLALKNKLSAGMIGDQTRLQVYNDVLREMNALNKSVLTVALDSGLIDKDAFQRFSEDIYYVPFYKAIENEDIEAPMLASGLTGQYFSKQLKGGEKKFGDLVENTLLNWNHILSAAMKNQAAVQTIRDASTFMMGDEAVVEPTTEKTGAAKVMIDGQARYFRINDPLLFESIGSIGYIGGQSYAIDIMRPFKNLLQMGVTISPQFRVNNLIRDSISSLAVTPINKNFAMNVLTGVSVYREKGGTFISALSGGAIFNFGTAYEGNQSVMIKRLIERGVNPDTILDDENKIKKGLKFLWDKYQDWGNASEAANRLALYKQLRDRGLSHLEATFQARDLLDFSMQGSWPTFRFLTQVVPFLNARVQGLYKLGRDGISPTVRVLYNSATGREIQATDAQKARAFSTVSMAVVLASMALYGAFKDDEEFKKRDDWDRDNFWWFRLPNMDVAFRIPKPFEIGAFGTLAERILEQMFDEEAEGKVFGDTLVRMLTDTFAINPTPQLFKPLLDIYANENAFTGAPIETEGQERLSKQERYNDRTSALAKALGGITGAFLPQEIELSPVQIDHLIQGYLGWLGATIATTSNYAVMPFNEGEYPDANWINRASLGLARDLPSPYSKYVTAFYKNGKAINQAYADMRHYAAIGQSEEVQRILEERGDKVSLAKLYDKTAKEMAKVRQHIRVIVADPQMTGAEKREEIDRLNMLIGEMAQNAEEIRRSVYAEQ